MELGGNGVGKTGLAVVAALICTAARAESLPVHSGVTQATISATTCVLHWTRTVRPEVSYTNGVKALIVWRAGLPESAMHNYVLDHIIPLSLGGSPRDPRNLMLQPEKESRIKDGIERCLARKVCAGKIDLETARRQIWANWRATACKVRK